jgi:putative DNA primase/helicase
MSKEQLEITQDLDQSTMTWLQPSFIGTTDDSSVAVWHSETHMKDNLAYNNAFGWLRYQKGRWEPVEKHVVVEMVRAVHEQLVRNAAGARSINVEELKRLQSLLAQPKIAKVVELLKGLVHVDADLFDTSPELLNVLNGVVNLRTGELLPHSPSQLLTKQVQTSYFKDATHKDWEAALEAIPEQERDWMRLRFGQGITGYPTPDDVLPILIGYGENGKSTIVVAIDNALGDYSTTVNERVLLANPSDHPTELMTLRGVRLGFIEELPEGKRLPVKRLKDVLGVEVLQARHVHKDNVRWKATHSLIVTTNYLPVVEEVDRATWRRLKVVRFPYTFVNSGKPLGENERVGDPMLRQRLASSQDGQSEAVLRWLVQGAVDYFKNPNLLRTVPPRIEEETNAWRYEVDVIGKFIAEKLDFSESSNVMSTELFLAFNDHLMELELPLWSDQVFTKRFQNHELVRSNQVTKKRFSSRKGLSSPAGLQDLGPNQYMGWTGLKFKTT